MRAFKSPRATSGGAARQPWSLRGGGCGLCCLPGLQGSGTSWTTGFKVQHSDAQGENERETLQIHQAGRLACMNLNCILLFGQPLLGVPHLEVHMVFFFFLACSLLCCMSACLQMRSSLSMIQKTNKQTHNISAICMKIDKKKLVFPFVQALTRQ